MNPLEYSSNDQTITAVQEVDNYIILDSRKINFHYDCQSILNQRILIITIIYCDVHSTFPKTKMKLRNSTQRKRKLMAARIQIIGGFSNRGF